eukprot:4301336-Alexandrium_andersonii.AAC.1
MDSSLLVTHDWLAPPSSKIDSLDLDEPMPGTLSTLSDLLSLELSLNLDEGVAQEDCPLTVSYTHLTLPTICSV